MKNTNDKMEKVRSQLNKLIEENASYDKILKKSKQLDKYIAKWYKKENKQ